MVLAKKKLKTAVPEEIKILQNFNEENRSKNIKVGKMEDLVHNFDVQKILKLNDKLRAYYQKVGGTEALELIDRMTVVMRELSEIINQVKAKRISLEQGQREIQEKIQEINEVLSIMKDWSATGL